jgi:hypothetical protein
MSEPWLKGVYPADEFGARWVQNWTISKRRLDAKIVASGAAIAPWVLHDFRRLISTTLHEIAMPPHIVEGILAHAGIRRAWPVPTICRFISTSGDAPCSIGQTTMMSIVAGVSPPANVIELRYLTRPTVSLAGRPSAVTLGRS